MDDEDEYLYGDAETVGAASPDDADATGRPPHRRHVKVDPPVTHWLALVRRGGSLHLHQLDHDHYLQVCAFAPRDSCSRETHSVL